MSFSLDPEVAAALAPVGEAMAATTPPAVGDIAGCLAIGQVAVTAPSSTNGSFGAGNLGRT